MIASTELYSLSVDSTRNRIYYTMIGFWQDTSKLARYQEDWENVLGCLSGNFTILSDLTEFRLLPPGLVERAAKHQKKLIDAGLVAFAEIRLEAAITALQLNRISDISGIEKRIFTDWNDAESWLDSFQLS